MIRLGCKRHTTLPSGWQTHVYAPLNRITTFRNLTQLKYHRIQPFVSASKINCSETPLHKILNSHGAKQDKRVFWHVIPCKLSMWYRVSYPFSTGILLFFTGICLLLFLFFRIRKTPIVSTKNLSLAFPDPPPLQTLSWVSLFHNVSPVADFPCTLRHFRRAGLFSALKLEASDPCETFWGTILTE